jgi:hypothetical protein
MDFHRLPGDLAAGITDLLNGGGPFHMTAKLCGEGGLVKAERGPLSRAEPHGCFAGGPGLSLKRESRTAGKQEANDVQLFSARNALTHRVNGSSRVRHASSKSFLPSCLPCFRN